MIFVDTTVWVGGADTNDDFHDSSAPIIEAFRTNQLPLAMTTDFVLDEVVTILGKRMGFGAEKARKVGENILASPRVFTIFVDETILKEALAMFPTYKGRLSLTDVVSTVVMTRYSVKEVFSHDKDFDLVSRIRRREGI